MEKRQGGAGRGGWFCHLWNGYGKKWDEHDYIHCTTLSLVPQATKGGLQSYGCKFLRCEEGRVFYSMSSGLLVWRIKIKQVNICLNCTVSDSVPKNCPRLSIIWLREKERCRTLSCFSPTPDEATPACRTASNGQCDWWVWEWVDTSNGSIWEWDLVQWSWYWKYYA